MSVHLTLCRIRDLRQDSLMYMRRAHWKSNSWSRLAGTVVKLPSVLLKVVGQTPTALATSNVVAGKMDESVQTADRYPAVSPLCQQGCSDECMYDCFLSAQCRCSNSCAWSVSSAQCRQREGSCTGQCISVRRTGFCAVEHLDCVHKV